MFPSKPPAAPAIAPENKHDGNDSLVEREGKDSSLRHEDYVLGNSEGSIEDGTDHCSEESDEPQFPEGSLQGWLTLSGVALMCMCAIGTAQTFGVFQDYYTRIALTEYSPSAISWIGSVQLSLSFALGIVSGQLFDRGYFHLPVISGSLIFLFSSFMLSIVQPGKFYQYMLSQGFGQGIGIGIMFLPGVGVLSHYFRRRRARAMGFAVAWGSVGAIIYPIVLNKIFFSSNLGFAWGVRIIAFLHLFFLLLANILMRPRLLPLRHQTVKLKHILSDKPYWLFISGMFLAGWGLFIPFFYLQLFSKLHGIPGDLLVWTIPILNAASFFGRILPNHASDYYGPLTVMVPSLIISASLLWVLLCVNGTASLLVFCLLYGFSSGTVMATIAPAIATFVTSPTLDDLGIKTGLCYLVMGVAFLTGSPIAGQVLAAPQYTWWKPLLFASISLLSGAMFVIFSFLMRSTQMK